MTIGAEDRFDAAPQLPRISAPALLIAGERDRNYTPALFRETAARILGARLRLYPGKGHARIATLRHKPAVLEIVGFLTHWSLTRCRSYRTGRRAARARER